MPVRIRSLVAGLLLTVAGEVTASDGVLEINHACATAAGGCFAGDLPGYPVQVDKPGSYRLTSNLDVPASTDGILVSNGVDLDLGGFEIAGPVSCESGCPPFNLLGGSGVAPLVGGGNRCSVANGKIRGFDLDGVRLKQQADVRRLRVSDIARDGLNLDTGSIAAENLISRVGQNGIEFLPAGSASLYERNTISLTGGQSVVEGRASAPNRCTDRLCGTSGRKFFYLSRTNRPGSTADIACEAGFHFASLWELADPSQLEYDTARGRTDTDSGEGPPNTTFGWVRTGFSTSAANSAGNGNCLDWSSNLNTDRGSAVGPNVAWNSTTSSPVDPWSANAFQCNGGLGSWCVQD